MADSTPPPDKTPELSEPPLGVLSSLSGLGLRLQRYALLGSQPLRISQPETLLSARSSMSADWLEPAQPPTNTDLVGKVDVSHSPETSPSSLEPPATLEPPVEPLANFAPLSAGDIIPPKPSKRSVSPPLQRQAASSPITPAAAGTADADGPPQSPQPPPSTFEPLSAGDIIPPQPSKRRTAPSISTATSTAPPSPIQPTAPSLPDISRQSAAGAGDTALPLHGQGAIPNQLNPGAASQPSVATSDVFPQPLSAGDIIPPKPSKRKTAPSTPAVAPTAPASSIQPTAPSPIDILRQAASGSDDTAIPDDQSTVPSPLNLQEGGVAIPGDQDSISATNLQGTDPALQRQSSAVPDEGAIAPSAASPIETPEPAAAETGEAIQRSPSLPPSGADTSPGIDDLPSTAPAATETPIAGTPPIQRTAATPVSPDASLPTAKLANLPDQPEGVATAPTPSVIAPSLPLETPETSIGQSDLPLQRQAESSSASPSASQIAAEQPLIQPTAIPLPPPASASEGSLQRRQASSLSPSAPSDPKPEKVEADPGSDALASPESTPGPPIVQRQTAPISLLSTTEPPLENAARSGPGTFQPASTVPGSAAPESTPNAAGALTSFTSGSEAVVPIQAKGADDDSPGQLPQAAPMPAVAPAPVDPADTGNDLIQRQTTAEVAFPPPSLNASQPIAGGEGPASVVDRKVDTAIAPTSTSSSPEAARPDAQVLTETGGTASSSDTSSSDAVRSPAPATLQRRPEDMPTGDENTATAALPATLPPSADPPPPDLSGTLTANAFEGTETSLQGVDDVDHPAASLTAVDESLPSDTVINRRTETDMAAAPLPISSSEGTALEPPSAATDVDSSLGTPAPGSLQRRLAEPMAAQLRSQPEPPAASTPALDSAAGDTGSISPVAAPANPTVPPSETISAEQADVDTTDRVTGDPGATLQRSLSETELTAPPTQLPKPVSAAPPISNQPQATPPEISGTQIADTQAAASSPSEDFSTAPTAETPADLVIQRRDLQTHLDPALPTENLAPSSTSPPSPSSPTYRSVGAISSTTLDTASPAAISTIQTFMDPSHAGDQQLPPSSELSAKVDSPAQDVKVARTEPLSPQPRQLESDVNESPLTIARALDNKRENSPVDPPKSQPAQSSEATFPSLPAVLTSLSVIQPFRLPETAPMQITDPARLPLPPGSAPVASPPPPVVPPPPPTSAVISSETAPQATPTVQRQLDTPPAALGKAISALTGESPTLASLSQAVQQSALAPSSPTDNPPQVQRQAAQSTPSSLAWGNVESLLNAPIPKKADSKTSSDQNSDRPSPVVADPSPIPYPDLKPFETLQRQLAQPSASVIQRDENAYATTITPDFDELPSDASPETLDLLVQQVYGLICQRLAVERERHGLFHRR